MSSRNGGNTSRGPRLASRMARLEPAELATAARVLGELFDAAEADYFSAEGLDNGGGRVANLYDTLANVANLLDLEVRLRRVPDLELDGPAHGLDM